MMQAIWRYEGPQWSVLRHLSTAARKAGAGLSGPNISGATRFYKHAGVVKDTADEGTYSVVLDGKTVKTPCKNPFSVTSQSLALAVAHEWDAQAQIIRPASMPMTTILAMTIDSCAEEKKQFIDEMMHYLESDTLCYQVLPSQQDKLQKLQHKKWEPLRKWFAERFEGGLDINFGLIAKLTHDEELSRNVRQFLGELSIAEIVPLRTITRECKSLITAVSLFERRISVKEAMEISRVEEEFQIDRWGLVEGGHDLDRVNCSVGIASASVFLWLMK